MIDDLRISAYQRRSPADLSSTTSDEVFLSGGDYEWKVRAITPTDIGTWSTPVAFHVDDDFPQQVKLTGRVIQQDFEGLGVQWTILPPAQQYRSTE